MNQTRPPGVPACARDTPQPAGTVLVQQDDAPAAATDVALKQRVHAAAPLVGLGQRHERSRSGLGEKRPVLSKHADDVARVVVAYMLDEACVFGNHPAHKARHRAAALGSGCVTTGGAAPGPLRRQGLVRRARLFGSSGVRAGRPEQSGQMNVSSV
jgi:hypothetical protein